MVFTVNGTSSWCSMVAQRCDARRTIAIEDLWNVVPREFRYAVASLRLSTSTRLNLDFPINGLRNEIVQTPGRFIKPAVEKCKSRRDRRSHENHDGIYRSPRVLPPFSRTPSPVSSLKTENRGGKSRFRVTIASYAVNAGGGGKEKRKKRGKRKKTRRDRGKRTL